MTRNRTWHVSRQYGHYKLGLYELRWWVRPMEWLANPFIEIGAHIRNDRLSMMVSEIGQKAYRLADKGEISMGELGITDEQARQLSPDLVDLFSDDKEEV